MIDTMTMGTDGASMLGSLRPKRRLTLQSLRRSFLHTFQCHDGRLGEDRWLFWTASGWKRLGYEQSDPGEWWVTPIGPMVLAIRIRVY